MFTAWRTLWNSLPGTCQVCGAWPSDPVCEACTTRFQGGRERCGNVVHIDSERAEQVRDAVIRARAINPAGITHPYGDGHSGQRIAAVLARINPHDPSLLRKHCPY